MALKSAHMAGLNVGGSVFAGARKWLDSVAVQNGAAYSYQPNQPPSNTMTSVGLLCRQYLGAKRDNPMLTGGMDYLMKHLPDGGLPQYLLLVLRDPGDAQHGRGPVGRLESQDA